ncbi:unnamed protein product [Lampetra planeri]
MAQKVGVMLPVVEEEARHLCAYEEIAGPARSLAHFAWDRGDVEGLPRPPTRHAPPAEEDKGDMVAALQRYPRIPREAERRPRRWAGEHLQVTEEVICHRCVRAPPFADPSLLCEQLLPSLGSSPDGSPPWGRRANDNALTPPESLRR